MTNEFPADNTKSPSRELGSRIPADCLGQRGLPSVRAELDALVDDLCSRLEAAGEKGLRGRQLAQEMNLTGTRALRLLVAYAQIAKGRTEIVGVPGSGYVWGPAAPEARQRMAGHAKKMGLDWLRKASDYRRPSWGPQLPLAFTEAEQAGQREASGSYGQAERRMP